ncbi:MAG: hypothetical protein LC102_09150 [Ignavibacteriales bacterium]|nr:MAG: hypothetical protein F9K26_05440 [Ignavibacteriaceae bacterium]MBW7872861.1 hypothetical protein [Ignavibacteria bacterium]MCZ2143581.1 hypothetical protein [Ignavibacteriales bacterium]MBV6444456.1 hypothetical protein [Ignavibacteriaceae bacterium]MBZ0197261.1 hypothetical protein [Ignavibacteriaceae bacterium]
MTQNIIADAEKWRIAKFEALGKACIEAFHEAENVWQAVEEYRLTIRREILRREQSGQATTRERAEYEEVKEMAEYFANKLATAEMRGV